MKKLFTLLPLCLLLCAYSSRAQIFWVENFESGSTSGLGVASYTGPNGAWSVTSTGAGMFANEWYVSCAEQGYTTGICGDGCSGPTGLGATLHVGGNVGFTGDMGASYFASGFSITNARAQSPTINCTGHSSITVSFYYIEAGEGTDDNGSLYYSPDGGSTWSILADLPKTPLTCAPQGTWTRYSYTLPASANNNANVKIGFLWVNDADATATDPSFAIDSMSMSSAGSSSGPSASFTASATTICEDSCITFTNTSTGSIDSIRWVAMGVLVPSTASVIPVCFTFTGTFPVTLRVYGGGTVDSQTTMITINPAPHPVITASGSTLTVTGTYTTYQWYKNDTAIAGATNNTYTYTGNGSYYVIVDSGGCSGMSNTILHTVGVAGVDLQGTRFYLTQSGPDMFTLRATSQLTEAQDVQVYDATGRMLFADRMLPGTDKKQFTIGGLATGIYIVRVGNVAVLKWLKQ